MRIYTSRYPDLVYHIVVDEAEARLLESVCERARGHTWNTELEKQEVRLSEDLFQKLSTRNAR